MSSPELPLDRLATTDEKGRRIFLHPQDVSGKYRTRRNGMHFVLIVFFLVLPWIQIGGHQALWIDIGRRRFSVFGLLFWAHDAPILVFLLAGFAITLVFITAVWGRFWCGWACPQTVFIDGVFRRIERWIEGDSLARRRLDKQSWNLDKLFKRAAKWSAYLLVSLIITHSFLAYFIGTGPLLKMMQGSPAQNPGDFILMSAFTALFLFNFGWFREQFCTIACPYGRLQSVLLDDKSLVIAYDAKRGEPRKAISSISSPDHSPSSEPSAPRQGDCVNCYRCVSVCPTGIDIRRGLQLECIACTSCIDACDAVMERFGRPKGLIRYDSLVHLLSPTVQQHLHGAQSRFSIRSKIYGAILFVIASGLIYTVSQRTPVTATVVRAIDTPYQILTSQNGGTEVLNHFKIHIENQSFDDQELHLSLPQEAQAAGVNFVISNIGNHLRAGDASRGDLFVRFPKHLLHFGRGSLALQIDAAGFRLKKEMTLVGPAD